MIQLTGYFGNILLRNRHGNIFFIDIRNFLIGQKTVKVTFRISEDFIEGINIHYNI